MPDKIVIRTDSGEVIRGEVIVEKPDVFGEIVKQIFEPIELACSGFTLGLISFSEDEDEDEDEEEEEEE